jgi:protein O-mannosyl-transferase
VPPPKRSTPIVPNRNRNRNRNLQLAAVFILTAFIAFAPSLDAPFDFDDRPAILDNTTIRQLWPPSALWRTPPFGTAVSGRPVVNYSFALNYALNRAMAISQTPASDGAEQTIGYHVANVLLHVAAALLLFAVIRRTVRSPAVAANWHESADWLAAIVAGIWLVHPIQTEAVDYVSQRTELMVSVCYLGTLYAAIRAWPATATVGSATPPRRGTFAWSLVAVVVCLLGMASKEVMISAPLMVMLYDRAFLAQSWRALWSDRARRWLYAGLVATMACSLALVAAGSRADTAGFDAGMPWYQYLYSQGWAIARYVRLTFWPAPLIFDYGRDPVRGMVGVPGGVLLLAAAAGTIVAWRQPRWRWAGFLGVWFFLLLAPSSSVVPVRTEIAAERRVYLASAALILLVVVAAEHVLRDRFAPKARRRVRSGVVAIIALTLFALTFARSAMYRDLEVRWRDAVAKTPRNGRAYDNLASAELRANPPNPVAADSALRRGMAADPTFVRLWVHSADIALVQNRLVDAESLLAHALRLHPGDAAATGALGEILVAEKRPDAAIPYLVQYNAVQPDANSLTALGLAYLMTRRLELAIAPLGRAARLDSARLDARRYLGAALVEQERGGEALPYVEQAARLDPASGTTLGLLSLAYAQAGRADAAVQAGTAAVANAHDNAAVYVFVGRAMETVSRHASAVTYLGQAIRLNPRDPQAFTRLGMSQAAMGDTANALRSYQRALALAPEYPPARRGIDQLAVAQPRRGLSHR